MDTLLRLIGGVVIYGGGAAAISYGLFKFLGQKWIESQFERSLERHKYELNQLYNRVTKIHEKEFEVLPIAWRKLLDAYSKIVSMTFPLQSYPDLNRMSSEQFTFFLSKTKLNELEKKELSDSSDKNRYYQGAWKQHQLRECREGTSDFHSYLLYNKIFLSADLFAKFNEVDKILSEALSKTEEGVELDDYSQITAACKMIDKKVEQLINDIEKLVQKRLHYDDAA